MRYSLAWALGITGMTITGIAAADADYRVVVVGAKIFPTKPQNTCWDPCLPRSRSALLSLSQQLASFAPQSSWTTIMQPQDKWLRGSKLPDPYAILQFSNGKRIQTHVVQDDLQPRWGTSTQVSLSSRDTLSITVYDKDIKRDDLIGHYPAKTIPADILAKGGTLNLRFQHVFEMQILFIRLGTNVLRRFIPGLYRVTVKNAIIAQRKADGRYWDAFHGNPDPFVVIHLGNRVIKTRHRSNTFTPEWNHVSEIYLYGDERFSFSVYDRDLSRHDLIGTCFFNQLRFAPLLHRQMFRWRCKQVEQINIEFHRLR